MGWFMGYEYRRRFEFKVKEDPLFIINKGCSELCEGDYHIGVSGELHLHERTKSFPDDIVFTSDDGVTILKKTFDFESFVEKHGKGKKSKDRLWVKFVDCLSTIPSRKIFKGYIYYGMIEGR